jgi:hypothetical protein
MDADYRTLLVPPRAYRQARQELERRFPIQAVDAGRLVIDALNDRFSFSSKRGASASSGGSGSRGSRPGLVGSRADMSASNWIYKRSTGVRSLRTGAPVPSMNYWRSWNST